MPTKTRPSWVRSLLLLLIVALLGAWSFAAAASQAFPLTRLEGESMGINCQTQSCLIIGDRLTLKFRSIHQGDIVAFTASRALADACGYNARDRAGHTVHRVVAAPGDPAPDGSITPPGYFWQAGDGALACNSVQINQPERISSIYSLVRVIIP